MRSNPIESAPRNQFIILQDDRKDSDVYEIARWSVERGDWIRSDGEPIQITPSHWRPLDHLCRLEDGACEDGGASACVQRFSLRLALAMMFVPSVLNNWEGPWEKESLFVAGSTQCPEGSSQDAANSPDSVIRHQQAAEQERQQIEVLARQLASAREDVGTLTARVTALTDARTEAEKALQTAQAAAAEQKRVAEQERQRGEALIVSSHPRARRSKPPQMRRTLPRTIPSFGRRAEAGRRARAPAN